MRRLAHPRVILFFWPMEVLRLAQVIAGLAQSEFAEQTGLSPATLSRFENGYDIFSMPSALNIKAEMQKMGLEFVMPEGEKGWCIQLVEKKMALAKIESGSICSITDILSVNLKSIFQNEILEIRHLRYITLS